MGIEESLPAGIALASMEKILGLARKHSQWPVTMGLACCAIEMMAAGTPRFDMSRFGLEVFRASPRHSDLMIVSGRVSHKMAPVIRRVYDSMADPKWSSPWELAHLRAACSITTPSSRDATTSFPSMCTFPAARLVPRR